MRTQKIPKCPLQVNATHDISKLCQIPLAKLLVKLGILTRQTAREIRYINFEISLVIFMPNITTNHAITFTNIIGDELLLNLTCEITKLPWQPTVRLRFRMVTKF